MERFTALRGKRIGVIGAGMMGQALINGLLARGVSASALRAAETNPATRRAVRRRFHIAAQEDVAWLVRRCDVVILAVKPQQLPEVVAAVAPHLGRRTLVISIAAGIRLRWLAARLPGVPIIRVMPNLPATVGCGFSALASRRGVRPRHRSIAAALFDAVGETVELPESHLDAITAISGSGPAYVFFVVQAWEAAARALGLQPAIASRAIRQTLRGSVELLASTARPPAALIRRVASKGGTTEAALAVLAHRHVSRHFVEALRAAARRSKALAWS